MVKCPVLFNNIAGDFDEPFFSESIDPTLEVIYPTIPPLPGQKIVGYYVYPASKKCLVPPCQRSLNFCGVFSSIALLIVFWPACFFPFCFGCSYNGYQIPIFR